MAELDVLARLLRAYPDARVRVVGYTDALGGAAANADLGRERAEAVAAALAGAGISRARVAAISRRRTIADRQMDADLRKWSIIAPRMRMVA